MSGFPQLRFREFERGESDISLEKFLIALSNMHIEVSEFMDAVNNYQRTEQIRFMSALIPLEYERNIAGFQKMQAEEAWEFSEHPDIYRHHLNVILLQSFICKCDATVPFPEEYIDEVTDYLFTTEEWNMYELILIGNLYLFIDIPLLHRMGQEILKRKDYYSCHDHTFKYLGNLSAQGCAYSCFILHGKNRAFIK